MRLQNTTQTELNIFNYDNGLIFLNTHYKMKKDQDPKFNYDQWSYSLGFQSRSFMYLICSGKRKLSADSSEKLAHYFKFSQKEYEHFVLITDHDKADIAILKKVFQDRALENLKFNELQLDQEAYNTFLSSPTLPLIRNILSFPDFVGTTENILKYIRLSEEQLDTDLKQLMKLGLIEQNKTNYRATNKNVKFPDNIENSAILNFHENALNEAILSNRMDQMEKIFRSLILAFNNQDFEALSEDVESFINKVKHKYSTKELNDNSLFRFNIQAYKVTK